MGKDIDVYNETPYVVGMDSKPYYYSGGAWHLLPGGGLLRRIAVDKANGKFWGVGTDAQVWYYSSSNTWIAYSQYHFGGTVVDICVYNDIPYIYITDGLRFIGPIKGQALAGLDWADKRSQIANTKK